MKRKNAKEEANGKWITKIFYCQSRRGGEASPVFSVRGWSNFRQRRTLLEVATVELLAEWFRRNDRLRENIGLALLNEPTADCIMWVSFMGITTNVFFFGLWLRIHCFDCLTQFRILFRSASAFALEILPVRPKTHSHEDGFGDDTAENRESRFRSHRILNFDNGFPRLFVSHFAIRRASSMIHSCKSARTTREW